MVENNDNLETAGAKETSEEYKKTRINERCFKKTI